MRLDTEFGDVRLEDELRIGKGAGGHDVLDARPPIVIGRDDRGMVQHREAYEILGRGIDPKDRQRGPAFPGEKPGAGRPHVVSRGALFPSRHARTSGERQCRRQNGSSEWEPG